MAHELLPESTRRLVADAPKDHGSHTHVGVLVPWANTMMEAELPSLGITNVVWHYTRLAPADNATALDDGFLAGLVQAIPTALHQLSRLPLSGVAVGCTSAGFRFPARIATAMTAAEVPVFTAFDAVVATLARMDASRVVLFTPYPVELTEHEVEAFEGVGIEVLAHASLGLRDRFAAVTRDQITAMTGGLAATALAESEAVVLSCTAWPTITAARTLESRLSRPVVSSNLAVAIHAASLISETRIR